MGYEITAGLSLITTTISVLFIIIALLLFKVNDLKKEINFIKKYKKPIRLERIPLYEDKALGVSGVCYDLGRDENGKLFNDDSKQ